MRVYTKIYSVTLGIQLSGFLFVVLADSLLSRLDCSSIFPVYVGGFFLLISMIAGVILPLRWCDSKREKVWTILLLPTNYTWVFIAASAAWFVQDILNILENIPANFG